MLYKNKVFLLHVIILITEVVHDIYVFNSWGKIIEDARKYTAHRQFIDCHYRIILIGRVIHLLPVLCCCFFNGELHPLVVEAFPKHIIIHGFLSSLAYQFYSGGSLLNTLIESHESQEPFHGDHGGVPPSQEPWGWGWRTSQCERRRTATKHKWMHQKHLHCE